MQETREDFIDETLKLWQPRTPQQLNHEDARQIIENVTGFFNVLLEWEKAERQSSTPVTDPDASSSITERRQAE